MSLPPGKKVDLIVRVTEDIGKVMVDSYRDLRRHEVSKEDATHIVRHAAKNLNNVTVLPEE